MLNYAKNNLIFDNPEYLKKQQLGLWVGKTPRKIQLYSQTKNELILPFGVLEKCFNLKCEFDRTDFPNLPIALESRIEAREYQFYAVKAIKKYKNGLVLMFAGSGKTQTALQAIAEIGQKTLWITHTQDLLTQAKQRAENNMEVITSCITAGICDISGDIVFATVQTLIKYVDKEILNNKSFGMIIVDEVHRLCVNAESMGLFQRCTEYFIARYKIGLTATSHRADGLFEAVKAIIGNPIYEMVRDDKRKVFSCQTKGVEVCTVEIEKFQVLALVHQIYTGYRITGKDELFAADGGTIVYAKLITDLTKDENRNNLIIKKLKELANFRTLIVSDRTEHLRYLCSCVDNGVYIDGKTKKQQREQNIQDMRAGKRNYFFGTWRLVKEGLDIPCIDNIIFASPNKDYAVIVQCIGRGQRPFKGKTVCNIWDYCDVLTGFFKASMYKRNSVYRKNGIKTCEVMQ